MSSFFAESLVFISDRPDTVCAFVTSSRQLFNSSIIPVTVNFEKLWHTLGTIEGPSNKSGMMTLLHRPLIAVFQHSDTLQFSPSLKIRHSFSHVHDCDFLVDLFQLLLAKRYFARTLRHLSVDTFFPHALKRVFKEVVSLESFAVTDSNGHLSDSDLGFVCEAQNLRSFSLKNCSEISDEGLQTLANKLPQLEYLSLPYCTKITPKGLISSLPKFQSLSTLIITSRASVDDEVMKNLFPSQLNTIRELDISNSQGVSDTGVAHLAHLPDLQVLNLSGCAISDVAIKSLASSWLSPKNDVEEKDDENQQQQQQQQQRRLPLRKLKLTYIDAKKVFSLLKHLGKILSLQEVVFQNLHFTNESMKVIGRMQGLTSLSFVSTMFASPLALQQLTEENGALPNLRHLKLASDLNVTSDGIASLQKLPSLASLCIESADTHNIDDACVLEFPKFPSLTSLDLSVGNKNRVSLQALLVALPACQKLTRLHLAEFEKITPKELRTLQKALRPKMNTVVSLEFGILKTVE